MSNKINKIVIVGGGSAGWMSASTMISQFPDKDVTVIESPNEPTIGVGESTIGGINNWLNLIGVDRNDFIPHTDATYKLSIRFTDFYRKGSGSFHYPFGHPDLMGNAAEKNDWYFKKFLLPETHVSDYAGCLYPNMAMVMENKIYKNEDGKLPNFVFNRDTAFQFDATKFAIWLRDNFSKPRGVNHIRATVSDINVGEDGINYLELDDGSKIEADLFIDCTGFKSLLLGGALNEPFISYADMLPNNSAWATRVPYTDKENQLVTYTDCHAIENGWVWNIPLWSRLGTGYVYSDKYISDEGALEEFKNHLKSKNLYQEDLQFKNIKMRVGIHKRLWVKNVCAIGLSGGFIEPLESSGLFTVHEFLLKLVRTLGRNQNETYVSDHDKDLFSFACTSQFRGFAEFVAAHFALSHRDDTPYWRDVGKRKFTNLSDLTTKPVVDEFCEMTNQRFRWYNYPEHGAGSHCIYTGMNCFPIDEYVMKSNAYYGDYKANWKMVVDRLDARKQYWRSIVQDSPTMLQYLKQNFYQNT